MTRARSLSQLANSSVFTVATNNRVGIGSEVPTAKLDVDGTLNVSGNATIGGVATYEDVTNVDSVGIVTARSGVSVPDGQKIQLGNSNDLQIYHDGTHSYIKNEGSGNLYIDGDTDDLVLQAGDDVRIQTQGNENAINCVGNGAVEIYYDNSKKFETTSTGVSITGILNASTRININNTTTTASDIIHSINTGSTLTTTQRTKADGTIQIGSVNGNTDTANIVLNANGTASFAGDGHFKCGGTAHADMGVQFINDGEVKIYRPTGGGGTVNLISGSAGVGSPSEQFAIKADGSATFAGAVTATGNNTSSGVTVNTTSAGKGVTVLGSSGGDIRLKGDGSATLNGPIKTRQDSNSALAFAVTQGGTANSDATIRFDGDGDATFAGVLRVDNQAQIYRPAAVGGSTSGNTLLIFKSDVGGTAVTKASITTNGAAEFADTVMRGTYSSGSSTARGSILGDGMVSAQQPAANPGSAIVWQGLHGTSITSKITAAGNVTLLGTYLQVGGVNTGNTNTSGAELYKSGVFYVQRTAAEATSARIFSSWHGSTENIAMFAGGDATFNGKLDVGKTYSGAEIARFGKTASGATSYLAFHTANANYAFIGTGDQLIANAGASDFGIRAQGHMIFSTGGNIERMRIDSSGNVGINHSSPQFGLTIGQSANNIGKIGWEDSGSQKRASITCSSSTDALQFHTGTSDTERMRITSGGVMQMGDPSSSGSGGVSLFTADPGTNHQRGRQLMYAKSTTSASQEIFQIFLGSTNKLLMRADGNLYNAAGGIGTLSDAKLKENIVDATSQWNDIKSLRIRKYNFKEETGHDTHTQIGLVAQEVETVSPGLVYDQPDKDENGNDLGTVTKVVNTSVFYMKTAKALQEAMARIETLEAEVAALKAS